MIAALQVNMMHIRLFIVSILFLLLSAPAYAQECHFNSHNDYVCPAGQAVDIQGNAALIESLSERATFGTQRQDSDQNEDAERLRAGQALQNAIRQTGQNDSAADSADQNSGTADDASQ